MLRYRTTMIANKVYLNIKKVFIFILFLLIYFYYLYDIKFQLLPYPSKVMLGFWGLLFILYLSTKNKIKCSKLFIRFIVYPFLLTFIFALLSSCINKVFDIFFLKHIGSDILSVIGAYFINVFFVKFKKANFSNFSIIYIAAISLQMFIALIFFFYPELLGYLKMFFLFTEKMESSTSYRFIGLGSAFFGAGVSASFALMFIANFAGYLKLNNYLATLLYFFIAFISLLMARTTFFGFLISLPILLYTIIKTHKKIQQILSTCFVLLIVLLVLSGIFGHIINQKAAIIENILKVAQHPSEYYDFYAGKSQNSMWKLPDNLKTWLIGDARLNTENKKYYMRTDFGYCRWLFYFGILGLLSYMHLQFSFIYLLSLKFKNKLVFTSFVLLYLVLNIKGIVSFIPYISPFLFIKKKTELR